ncbi:MAG: hypothetical protein PF487_08355 [Bacteroidales bacterium]|jgi:hypothetical protein|nr:hypothetical protein [Bacteroidales bacterium]
MKNKIIELGHQAPKGFKVNKINRFNSIEISGDLHYCYSHNFVYNCEKEESKLYNAEPCYYTDNRFVDDTNNFFKNTYLYWTRWSSISLKACIRRTLQTKNIPVGTIVDFKKSWYYRCRNIDNGYKFKIRKFNPLDIKYEINMPKYKRNFDNDVFSQKLTDTLRAKGFIVGVSKGNPNFISKMISTAAAYKGNQLDVTDDDGQSAVAYGHGRIIGFSTSKNNFRGYSNGCENILYDFHGKFNKWSQCIEIHKSTPIDEIIKELTDDEKTTD